MRAFKIDSSVPTLTRYKPLYKHTIHLLNSRTVKVQVAALPFWDSNFYFNVGAKIWNFKFEVKFNKFAFFHSKYYLHEIAE
jgi:hypothetical protein